MPARTSCRAFLKFEVALAQPGLEATYDVICIRSSPQGRAGRIPCRGPSATHMAIKPFIRRGARRTPVHGLRNLKDETRRKCALHKNYSHWPARPRWSPAARAASACRWPKRWASRAPSCSPRASRPTSTKPSPPVAARHRSVAIAADLSQDVHAIGRWSTEADQAPRPHRHPDQQRRRQLGRAGRRLPVEAWDKVMNLNIRSIFLVSQAGRQAVDDSAQVRPHHQHRVDRRPGRQPAGHHARRSPTTPPRARWSTSPARWRASGAATASPSTRSRRASSRPR
jgi:hypothetical protein